MGDAPGSPRPGTGLNGQIIARSEAMREILALVRKIAGSDVPVLIQGEIGVGKRVVAQEIHRQSRRAAGPFVGLACGALRESELEEKLFGEPWDEFRMDAGAPAGVFEASRRGTLLLDGVTQLPLWAQAKLLDALKRGGGQNRADVAGETRVIASITGNPETAVAEDCLHSGLYYHLGAVRIDIPPLRHRQEDLRALAEAFLAAAVAKLGASAAQLPWHFSEEAWQRLRQHDWPGNRLELSAAVAHAVAMADGPEIGRECVEGSLLSRGRPSADAETVTVPLAGGLKEMQRAVIDEVIRRCRGNKAAAARNLRLHRRTLYRMLEE